MYKPVDKITHRCIWVNTGQGKALGPFRSSRPGEVRGNIFSITGMHCWNVLVVLEIITGNLEKVINTSDIIVITQKKDLYSYLYKKYSNKYFIYLVYMEDYNGSYNVDGICW